MLQIIGWLGCVMLAVKILEMNANPAMRDDQGEMKGLAMAGIVIGWIGVFGFAFWLLAHGGAFVTQDQRLDELTRQADEAERVADCMEAASPDLNAMLACQN